MEKQFLYQKLPVRIITDDQEHIWFVATDVCKVLGYPNVKTILEAKLDDDEKKLDYIKDSSGQRRKTWTINEFGVYSLVLTSNKPKTKAFKKWIAHNILPNIRKAGKFLSEDAKNHEIQLLEQAEKLNNLNKEKYSCQKKNNELRNAIKIETAKLINLVKMDQSQLKLSFNKK